MIKKALTLGVSGLIAAAIFAPAAFAQSATSVVGDDGVAISNAVTRRRLYVRVRNNANVTNYSAALSVTGGNTQSFNDDHTSMGTGGATAGVSTTNVVNTNTVNVTQH